MTIPLNNEKRYETNLPFKGNHPILYDHLCKNRLEQRFKKLKKNKEFQTFAENRVQEINDSRGCRGWYYHNTKINQADLSARIQNFSDFQNCDSWWAGSNFLRGKRFNDRDGCSSFAQDFDKRLSNRDGFSNFAQDFDKSFFHELTSTACLQQSCKHVFDELADVSI